jgi:hypothetical protein
MARIAVVLSLVFALAAAAGASAAPAPAGDSVTGTVATGEARSFIEFTFDAHSGPSGENPTGTVHPDAFFGDLGVLEVSCLGVSANRATVIVKAPPNTSGIAGLEISVEDDGPGQDRLDWHVISALPSACPAPSNVLAGTESGDLVVTDAPPPTRFAQCRHGGWLRYGFASKAACIAYVHEQSRQECIFERAYVGISAFRAKYGRGPQHVHAMRRCVRRRAG